MTTQSNDSLVYGILNAETFNDFVARLHHDVRGKRVDDHFTADAIFNVMENKMIVGIDPDYASDLAYFDDEGGLYRTPKEFFDSLDEEDQEILKGELSKVSECEGEWDDDFVTTSDFITTVSKVLDMNIVFTGYSSELVHVSTHLTHDAAEAYIKRNQHNHQGKLIVYVDSRCRSPEITAIINGLLDGKIVFKG